MSLLPARIEEDPFKNEGTRVAATSLHFTSQWNFFLPSRAAYSPAGGLTWQSFKTILDFMVALVICKNEEDPFKNKGAKVVTILFTGFSDAQGQLTQ